MKKGQRRHAEPVRHGGCLTRFRVAGQYFDAETGLHIIATIGTMTLSWVDISSLTRAILDTLPKQRFHFCAHVKKGASGIQYLFILNRQLN